MEKVGEGREGRESREGWRGSRKSMRNFEKVLGKGMTKYENVGQIMKTSRKRNGLVWTPGRATAPSGARGEGPRGGRVQALF